VTKMVQNWGAIGSIAFKIPHCSKNAHAATPLLPSQG
jgi:hypothetical protein